LTVSEKKIKGKSRSASTFGNPHTEKKLSRQKTFLGAVKIRRRSRRQAEDINKQSKHPVGRRKSRRTKERVACQEAATQKIGKQFRKMTKTMSTRHSGRTDFLTGQRIKGRASKKVGPSHHVSDQVLRPYLQETREEITQTGKKILRVNLPKWEADKSVKNQRLSEEGRVRGEFRELGSSQREETHRRGTKAISGGQEKHMFLIENLSRECRKRRGKKKRSHTRTWTKKGEGYT